MMRVLIVTLFELRSLASLEATVASIDLDDLRGAAEKALDKKRAVYLMPQTVLALVRVVEAALADRQHRHTSSTEAQTFEELERDYMPRAAELDNELNAALEPFRKEAP